MYIIICMHLCTFPNSFSFLIALSITKKPKKFKSQGPQRAAIALMQSESPADLIHDLHEGLRGQSRPGMLRCFAASLLGFKKVHLIGSISGLSLSAIVYLARLGRSIESWKCAENESLQFLSVGTQGVQGKFHSTDTESYIKSFGPFMTSGIQHWINVSWKH